MEKAVGYIFACDYQARNEERNKIMSHAYATKVKALHAAGLHAEAYKLRDAKYARYVELKSREREVLTQLRKSRMVSIFWLLDPNTRWRALHRLEKRGVVAVKVMPYPFYRVTIHRIKQ